MAASICTPISTTLTDVTAFGGPRVAPALHQDVQHHPVLVHRVVDAAEDPPGGLLGQKWYEVTKYLSLTDHQFVLHLLQVNGTFWKGLPVDYQHALQKAADEAVVEYNRNARTNRTAEIAELKANGLDVNEIADKAPFIQAAAPYNREFIARLHLEPLAKAVETMAA